MSPPPQVTIIDYTASRLTTCDGGVAFCDMTQDPEVFTGPQGEVQYDTYRDMRDVLRDDWRTSNLATNCLWIHYLTTTILQHKLGGSGSGARVGLRAPGAPTSAEKRELREFAKRAKAASSCKELMHDPLIVQAWRWEG